MFAENNVNSGEVPIIKAGLLSDQFRDTDEYTIRQHIELLQDRDLVKAGSNRDGAYIIRIKFDGYEFLDNARDPNVWNAAIKAAGGLSWGVFTNVLNSAAVDHAKSLLHSAKVLLTGGS